MTSVEWQISVGWKKIMTKSVEFLNHDENQVNNLIITKICCDKNQLCDLIMTNINWMKTQDKHQLSSSSMTQIDWLTESWQTTDGCQITTKLVEWNNLFFIFQFINVEVPHSTYYNSNNWRVIKSKIYQNL